MIPPLRVYCIIEGEAIPQWMLSRDFGVTFQRADYDRTIYRLPQLTLVGAGHNDPELTKLFPRSQRACFQAAGKYGTDTT